MRSPSQRPGNTEEILQGLSQIKQISSLPTSQKTIPVSINKVSNSTVISPPQPNQIETPSTINAGFFYQWVLSNIVGIGIGVFLRTIFNGAVYSIFGANLGSRYAMLAAIITWVPVDIMQWLVLKQRIKFNLWSFIETLFAFLAGLFIGTFSGRFLLGSGGQLVGALVGVIAGTSIAKWLTIRRQIKKTLIWFLVSLIGLFISILFGSIIGVTVYFLLNQAWNQNATLTVSFALGVGSATILSSLITGGILLRLLRRLDN